MRLSEKLDGLHYKELAFQPRYKLIGQVTLGLLVGLYTWFDPAFSVLLSTTTVPFFKHLTLDYGFFYIPIVIFIITAVSNAVNLTDGLDGLAAGTSAIVVTGLGGFSYLAGNAVYAVYPHACSLTTVCRPALGGSRGRCSA